MLEKDLRRWHRNLAIVFVIFIILQALTGLLMTLDDIKTPQSHAHEAQQEVAKSHGGTQEPEQDSLETLMALIHHGGGVIGLVYRIILGLGMLAIAGSGAMIYMKIQARTRARKSN